MHENAEKFDWKLEAKFLAIILSLKTWKLPILILSGKFFSLQVNNYSKKKRKGEIGKVKKIYAVLSHPKTQIFIFVHVQAKLFLNSTLVERKVCCLVVNAFFEWIGANMAHIVAENVQKMSKKYVLRKSSRSEWVKPKLTSR